MMFKLHKITKPQEFQFVHGNKKRKKLLKRKNNENKNKKKGVCSVGYTQRVDWKLRGGNVCIG